MTKAEYTRELAICAAVLARFAEDAKVSAEWISSYRRLHITLTALRDAAQEGAK